MNHRQWLLVVDRSATTREALTGYLNGIGYRTRVASNGADALAILRGGLQTDAVVYDASLPAMGGRAFVAQLGSDRAATPVLLMTTKGDADAQGAGAADAVIAKPFQLVDFGDRLLRMWAAPARAT
jgi:CheY-like chemotaxis protein